MAIHFTEQQKKVLEARNHDVLVSAAAGSGKTAVLVERIIRLISEGPYPMDIDRILVVTFTRAAAAQMRERIGNALSRKIESDPENRHLHRQESLLYNAQITTIDSFCSFLLKNNFSEIDLDPGFRMMDETEASLFMMDSLEDFLELQYEEAGENITACANYFCTGSDDRGLRDLILQLYRLSSSHPSPGFFLRQRKKDYLVSSVGELMNQKWLRELLLMMRKMALEYREQYDSMIGISLESDGPYPYTDFLSGEKEILFGPLEKLSEDSDTKDFWNGLASFAGYDFAALPRAAGKKYDDISPGKKETVQGIRNAFKKVLKGWKEQFFRDTPERVAEKMLQAYPAVEKLLDLTIAFREYYGELKKQKNMIDFDDLEHFALKILLEEHQDGSFTPRKTAESYRKHFDEIMIDEYQDSNDVQELLLRTISGEEEGRYDRFMVGDVKQSIYKFRLARPEIFLEKFESYHPDEEKRERIDLDRNFRSRKEVLDLVNYVFQAVMRREIGGVEYDDTVSLKAGAAYPDPPEEKKDAYIPELLVVTEESEEEASGAEEEQDEIRELLDLTPRRKEALCIVKKIREMVGVLPVRDEEAEGGMRPARYSDIVILLRSNAGWNEEFRAVFEREGIPAYIDSRTGYFSAEEIREVLCLLRVLNNPRQDIPLYGVLRGYFGRFSEETIAEIRGRYKEGDLYEALENAQEGEAFLEKLARWRKRAALLSVHDLLLEIFEEADFESHIAALPAGEQRSANLQMLLAMAKNFEKTKHTGVFRFLRYIDRMDRYEADYGEANILSEKADVVRIMSIHKSKGLEFPICFVSGLAKGFNRRDLSGAVLCDSVLGIGVDHVDQELRCSTATLRKKAVAEKNRLDMLGEELRVFYVAMTRAKEKLIFTAYFKSDFQKACEKTGRLLEGCREEHLPVSWIQGAGSYLALLQGAMVKGKGIPEALLKCSVIPASLLRESGETEQNALSARYGELERTLYGEKDFSEQGLAEQLRRQLSYRYGHEGLQELFTKTTVSELKKKHLDELLLAAQDESGEGENRLYPERVPVPVIPEFIREKEETEEKNGNAGVTGGAARGSAVHKLMEILDYGRFTALPAEETAVREWIREQAEAGRIPPVWQKERLERPLALFLNSSLGKRMAAAEKAGVLHREQPFVLGIPASEIREGFPEEEMILLQGIIDAWFEEDGEIILVDYKTDRLPDAEAFREKYSLQLDCYQKALEQILEKRVAEKILYSFALKAEINCPSA